jgi:hypothetical protein
MEDSQENRIERYNCTNCGTGERRHLIVASYRDEWSSSEDGEYGHDDYLIARCCGCELVKFILKSWVGIAGCDPLEEGEETIRIYPREMSGRSSEHTFGALNLHLALPDKVSQMHNETVKALNVGAYTLGGAGLRAIVEALCLDQGVAGRNLQQKIDALVSSGKLAKSQADHLHEERFLGNAAVHELERLTARDLEDGLEIIEGLLKTIYILPRNAAAMRKRRESRKATRASTDGDM